MLSPSAYSGELVLLTGDRVEGELIRLQGDVLYWKSRYFGEIQVSAAEVNRVETAQALKLDGHEDACYWVAMERGTVRFECDDGDSGVVDLMSLNMVIPHHEYANGDYNYRGRLTLSGRQASGNKDEEIWAVDSETQFRRGDYRHESQVRFDSISHNGESAQSRGQLRYSLDWFFQEQWFWYNNVRFGFDGPANIDESYVYGMGVGYQVWENSISALSIETGFDYVKEHLSEPAAPTPDFESSRENAAWRWALDYRYLLPFNVALFHRHQLSQSLEHSDDWVLESATGISMPLTGQLHSEIKLDHNIDNRPAEGSVRRDKQITVGVGYSW